MRHGAKSTNLGFRVERVANANILGARNQGVNKIACNAAFQKYAGAGKTLLAIIGENTEQGPIHSLSRSAEANTIFADLPPSSIVTGEILRRQGHDLLPVSGPGE